MTRCFTERSDRERSIQINRFGRFPIPHCCQSLAPPPDASSKSCVSSAPPAAGVNPLHTRACSPPFWTERCCSTGGDGRVGGCCIDGRYFPVPSDAGEVMDLDNAVATLSHMRDETTVLDGEPDKSSGGADCRGCTRGTLVRLLDQNNGSSSAGFSGYKE